MKSCCWRGFFHTRAPLRIQFHTLPRRHHLFSRQLYSFVPNRSRFVRLNHLTDSNSSPALVEDIYFLEVDVENFEEYRHGGYHPSLIGDTFCDNRYTIVHKLGFGGYSTIWLARDQQLQRYVSLKILAASASGESAEGTILSSLRNGDSAHIGKQFIPLLLDQFSFNGPNGHHLCLVGQPFGCSIARSQEDSVDLMFPVDAARSIAAQLIVGLSYLQACGICHGARTLASTLFPFSKCAHELMSSYRFTHKKFPLADPKLRFYEHS